jgi:hypothetical protein
MKMTPETPLAGGERIQACQGSTEGVCRDSAQKVLEEV